MKTVLKVLLAGVLAAASTTAFAQATSPTPTSPPSSPSSPMPGMMMMQQPGGTQQAPAQGQSQQGGMMQGGMMQCGMMQRSAETADAVKQLQQQLAEMRAMLEQMAKR